MTSFTETNTLSIKVRYCKNKYLAVHGNQLKIKRQRLPGKFIVNRHCPRCCSIEQQRNVDVFIPEQQKQKTNIVPLLASFVVSLDLAALHILQTLFLLFKCSSHGNTKRFVSKTNDSTPLECPWGSSDYFITGKLLLLIISVCWRAKDEPGEDKQKRVPF